jgi:hypothetical protein
MNSEPLPAAGTRSDLSLRHLQAELARIDVLVRYEVRRWQVAGQDPADAFRGLHVSQAEAAAVANRSSGASWGQTVALAPEEHKAFSAAYAQAAERAQRLSVEAGERGEVLRLEHLAVAFDLDAFDLDTLLICLALALDLRYERLYGFLQDDVTRKRPSINLVLDLLGPPDPADRPSLLLRFADDAPLFKYHLLERGQEQGPGHPPLLGQVLSVDPAVVAWLLGKYEPHSDLESHARLSQPRVEEADILLGGGVDKCQALLGCVDSEEAAPSDLAPIVVFRGPDDVSQRAASRVLAAHSRRPLLTVELAAVTSSGVAPTLAVRLALRDARLTGAIPFLSGWDGCFESEQAAAPPPELLEELSDCPGLVIVGGRSAWRPSGPGRQRPIVWAEFPIPGYAQRLTLWQHFIGQEPSDVPETVRRSAAYLEAIGLRELAGQFSLTTGQIRDSVASARDRLFQAQRSLRRDDLLAAARAHSNPRLAELARKIEPRYGWDDIILPEDQLELLHEIVDTVRGRPLVLEEWGVGRKLASSAGVTVLFSGRPGTGKTMGAEILANELGLDLFKIDLSSIVSKYIGETEKNLERIFAEAQSSNAILFFDEADAIFGKRSEVKDAHDRYANIEVSYLLQRMEMYDGVTILATNLRANLDEAFTRRLQFAVDFPFPDEHYRQRIWETLFPSDVPREPDLDFGLLARRFRFSGGNIRNVLVSAAYLAAADGRRVGMKHLLHGTRRELQKMGRLVKDQDMTW